MVLSQQHYLRSQQQSVVAGQQQSTAGADVGVMITAAERGQRRRQEVLFYIKLSLQLLGSVL